jgi:hypothetical protein
MQSSDRKAFYSFRADANALGGFLEEPLRKSVPTLAPVSLPAAGGFATARSGAFNLDEIVSCSSAYTLVTGRENNEDGSFSTLATAVVEGLNILEVVTAERIVAQITVTIPKEPGPRRISLGGTRFEGLRLAGRDSRPILNSTLQQPDADTGTQGSPLAWRDIQRAGREQAERLINRFKDGGDGNAYQWALNRHGWMASEPRQGEGGHVLCSLVDGFEEGEGSPRGHIVDIPDFGRIILGELLLTRDSVQLVSLRAELGCPIKGTITGPTPATSGGRGSGDTS